MSPTTDLILDYPICLFKQLPRLGISVEQSFDRFEEARLYLFFVDVLYVKTPVGGWYFKMTAGPIRWGDGWGRAFFWKYRMRFKPLAGGKGQAWGLVTLTKSESLPVTNKAPPFSLDRWECSDERMDPGGEDRWPILGVMIDWAHEVSRQVHSDRPIFGTSLHMERLVWMWKLYSWYPLTRYTYVMIYGKLTMYIWMLPFWLSQWKVARSRTVSGGLISRILAFILPFRQ